MNIKFAIEYGTRQRAADSNTDIQIPAAAEVGIQRLDDAQVHSPIGVHVHLIVAEELNGSSGGHVGSFSNQAKPIKRERPVGNNEVNGAVIPRFYVLNVGKKFVHVPDHGPVIWMPERSMKGQCACDR